MATLAPDDRRRNGAAPDRTLVQRRAALIRANDVRLYRAELKKDLKRGTTRAGERVTLTGLLLRDEVPELLETMKVNELLIAAPRLGRVKARKILERARISPSKTLAGLTDRQRRELIAVLQAYPSLRR